MGLDIIILDGPMQQDKDGHTFFDILPIERRGLGPLHLNLDVLCECLISKIWQE